MGFKIITGTVSGLPLAKEIVARVGAELLQIPMKTEDDIIKHAADADAVIAGPIEPYTQKALQAMTKCKVISRIGIGYDNIDVKEATRQGIPVAVVLDASIHEVSDQTMCFILALSRKLFPLVQTIRAGGWKSGSQEVMKARGQMFRLTQQKLGLIGMGRIGQLVAQKAKAFGLRVLVHDPYLTPEAVKKAGAELVDFDYLLQESDFISLHIPLTKETKGLLGLKEFRKMKPTAYIINVSRGGIIDEQALYQAINERSVAGCGLDVTDPEPPDSDNPLLKLEQVLITGHSAWFSESSLLELERQAAEAVLWALQGHWPRTLANPDVKQRENRRIA